MSRERARVLLPNRLQMEFRPCDLEALLPEGHRARLVWAYVERQDLGQFYATIRVQEGGVGRTAIAPEVLLSLWLFATLDGVGSARELARLTQAHDAYRWLCGGVQVNHHTLSDFRKDHGEALDELLSENVASLMAIGLVKLKRVAQDGMRVRASAGAASFRRKETLEGLLEVARAEVARLKSAVETDPGEIDRRRDAARRRAAVTRERQVEEALARLPEIEAIKRRNRKDVNAARASTTDADATVMKMADGGYRPAYNPQLASDADSLVIVGVDVTTEGTDMKQLVPMLSQVTERCGQVPEAWLVDGGYTAHEQIELASATTTVYGPVPASRDERVDEHAPKAKDSEAVAAWRERMGTDEAKSIYRDRASTAECVNAQARNRGLLRFLVRGQAKVKCVMLLHALAHNLMRAFVLMPDWLGVGTGPSAAAAATG